MFSEVILTQEIKYIIIVSAILLLPQILRRFRVPGGITAFFIGVLCLNGFHAFAGDSLINILSQLGITSLFLLAGLEIDLNELIEEKKVVLVYLVKSTALIFLVAFSLSHVLGISFRAAVIFSLGVMTPSAGFILHSLKSYNLTTEQEKWIRIKALSFEITAILLMFLVLQSKDMGTLAFSSISLVVFVILLPLLFKVFFKFIAPYAPDSELSFLVLVALIGGLFTRSIGAYYLVGAFIAGLMASEFKYLMHDKFADKLEHSVELFVMFFIPFYFFAAGLKVDVSYFSGESIRLAAALVLIFIPIRILSVYSTIWLKLRSSWESRKKIAFCLVPTLVFGLVISSILKEEFALSNSTVGGLIIYTIAATLVPAIFVSRDGEKKIETAPPI